jgi:hypothetical protein
VVHVVAIIPIDDIEFERSFTVCFLRLLINNSDLCFGKALLLLMCNDLIPTMLRTMFCVVLALSGACTGLAPGHSLGCADGEGLIEKYGRAA